MKQRRRNSCLAGLERLRRACPGLNMSDAIVFLYVCENEGVNLRELEQLAGLCHSTASRAARRMVAAEDPFSLEPYFGMLCMRAFASDRRAHTIHLSDKGRALAEELDRLILAPEPIFLQTSARSGGPG